ncbi:hypothetical protein SAMN05444678_1303 [Sphingomonas sp. YR710]|nr:hypothetical protein SAMN05444678_1303 [Sphingomonas sp. YR710]
MSKVFISPLVAFALLAGSAVPAWAAPYRDAKGKFIKCPPAAPAIAASSITKDAKGKCRVASGPKKGQFTKCP